MQQPVGQAWAAARAGLTDWSRDRVLWVLLAAVPATFIVLATALAPSSQARLTLDQNGRQVTKVVNLAFGAGIHPAFMAPVAITALAVRAGMFIILDSRAADQRLVLAGIRPGSLLASRLGLISAAALLAAGVSLAVTAAVANISQPVIVSVTTICNSKMEVAAAARRGITPAIRATDSTRSSQPWARTRMIAKAEVPATTGT